MWIFLVYQSSDNQSQCLAVPQAPLINYKYRLDEFKKLFRELPETERLIAGELDLQPTWFGCFSPPFDVQTRPLNPVFPPPHRLPVCPPAGHPPPGTSLPLRALALFPQPSVSWHKGKAERGAHDWFDLLSLSASPLTFHLRSLWLLKTSSTSPERKLLAGFPMPCRCAPLQRRWIPGEVTLLNQFAGK